MSGFMFLRTGQRDRQGAAHAQHISAIFMLVMLSRCMADVPDSIRNPAVHDTFPTAESMDHRRTFPSVADVSVELNNDVENGDIFFLVTTASSCSADSLSVAEAEFAFDGTSSIAILDLSSLSFEQALPCFYSQSLDSYSQIGADTIFVPRRIAALKVNKGGFNPSRQMPAVASTGNTVELQTHGDGTAPTNVCFIQENPTDFSKCTGCVAATGSVAGPFPLTQTLHDDSWSLPSECDLSSFDSGDTIHICLEDEDGWHATGAYVSIRKIVSTLTFRHQTSDWLTITPVIPAIDVYDVALSGADTTKADLVIRQNEETECSNGDVWYFVEDGDECDVANAVGDFELECGEDGLVSLNVTSSAQSLALCFESDATGHYLWVQTHTSGVSINSIERLNQVNLPAPNDYVNTIEFECLVDCYAWMLALDDTCDEGSSIFVASSQTPMDQPISVDASSRLQTQLQRSLYNNPEQYSDEIDPSLVALFLCVTIVPGGSYHITGVELLPSYRISALSPKGYPRGTNRVPLPLGKVTMGFDDGGEPAEIALTYAGGCADYSGFYYDTSNLEQEIDIVTAFFDGDAPSEDDILSVCLHDVSDDSWEDLGLSMIVKESLFGIRDPHIPNTAMAVPLEMQIGRLEEDSNLSLEIDGRYGNGFYFKIVEATTSTVNTATCGGSAVWQGQVEDDMLTFSAGNYVHSRGMSWLVCYGSFDGEEYEPTGVSVILLGQEDPPNLPPKRQTGADPYPVYFDADDDQLVYATTEEIVNAQYECVRYGARPADFEPIEIRGATTFNVVTCRDSDAWLPSEIQTVEVEVQAAPVQIPEWVEKGGTVELDSESSAVQIWYRYASKGNIECAPPFLKYSVEPPVLTLSRSIMAIACRSDLLPSEVTVQFVSVDSVLKSLSPLLAASETEWTFDVTGTGLVGGLQITFVEVGEFCVQTTRDAAGVVSTDTTTKTVTEATATLMTRGAGSYHICYRLSDDEPFQPLIHELEMVFEDPVVSEVIWNPPMAIGSTVTLTPKGELIDYTRNLFLIAGWSDNSDVDCVFNETIGYSRVVVKAEIQMELAANFGAGTYKLCYERSDTGFSNHEPKPLLVNTFEAVGPQITAFEPHSIPHFKSSKTFRLSGLYLHESVQLSMVPFLKSLRSEGMDEAEVNELTHVLCARNAKLYGRSLSVGNDGVGSYTFQFPEANQFTTDWPYVIESYDVLIVCADFTGSSRYAPLVNSTSILPDGVPTNTSVIPIAEPEIHSVTPSSLPSGTGWSTITVSGQYLHATINVTIADDCNNVFLNPNLTAPTNSPLMTAWSETVGTFWFNAGSVDVKEICFTDLRTNELLGVSTIDLEEPKLLSISPLKVNMTLLALQNSSMIQLTAEALLLANGIEFEVALSKSHQGCDDVVNTTNSIFDVVNATRAVTSVNSTFVEEREYTYCVRRLDYGDDDTFIPIELFDNEVYTVCFHRNSEEAVGFFTSLDVDADEQFVVGEQHIFAILKDHTVPSINNVGFTNPIPDHATIVLSVVEDGLITHSIVSEAVRRCEWEQLFDFAPTYVPSSSSYKVLVQPADAAGVVLDSNGWVIDILVEQDGNSSLALEAEAVAFGFSLVHNSTASAKTRDNSLVFERPMLTILSSSRNVTEGSEIAEQLFLRLRDEPVGGDVVVDVSSADEQEVEVSPSKLTFTSNNWDKYQMVEIWAVDDPVVDGLQTASISLVVNRDIEHLVDFHTADNDVVGVVVVEPKDRDLYEGVTEVQIGLLLESQPSREVYVTVATSDPSVVVFANPTEVGAVFQFDSSNWNVTQNATVTAPKDTDNLGADETVWFYLSSVTSSDPLWVELYENSSVALQTIAFEKRNVVYPDILHMSESVCSIIGCEISVYGTFLSPFAEISVEGFDISEHNTSVYRRLQALELSQNDTSAANATSESVVTEQKYVNVLTVVIDAPEGLSESEYAKVVITNPDGADWSLENGLFFSTSSCRSMLFYEDSDGLCRRCPEGAECPGGSRVWPGVGYWNSNEFALDVTQCPFNGQHHCLGTKFSLCAKGYSGIACLGCDDSYFRQSDTCVECYHIAVHIILLLLFLAFVTFVLVASIHFHFGTFNFLAYGFAQVQEMVLAVLFFNDKVGEPTLKMFNFFRIFLLDVSQMQMECLFSSQRKLMTLFILTLAMPLVLVVLYKALVKRVRMKRAANMVEKMKGSTDGRVERLEVDGDNSEEEEGEEESISDDRNSRGLLLPGEVEPSDNVDDPEKTPTHGQVRPTVWRSESAKRIAEDDVWDRLGLSGDHFTPNKTLSRTATPTKLHNDFDADVDVEKRSIYQQQLKLRQIAEELRFADQTETYSTLASLIYLTIPMVLLRSFQTLNCAKIEGQFVMTQFPEDYCFEGMHFITMAVTVVVVSAALWYPISIALKAAARRVRLQHIANEFGNQRFLYILDQYRSDRYWLVWFDILVLVTYSMCVGTLAGMSSISERIIPPGFFLLLRLGVSFKVKGFHDKHTALVLLCKTICGLTCLIGAGLLEVVSVWELEAATTSIKASVIVAFYASLITVSIFVGSFLYLDSHLDYISPPAPDLKGRKILPSPEELEEMAMPPGILAMKKKKEEKERVAKEEEERKRQAEADANESAKNGGSDFEEEVAIAVSSLEEQSQRPDQAPLTDDDAEGNIGAGATSGTSSPQAQASDSVAGRSPTPLSQVGGSVVDRGSPATAGGAIADGSSPTPSAQVGESPTTVSQGDGSDAAGSSPTPIAQAGAHVAAGDSVASLDEAAASSTDGDSTIIVQRPTTVESSSQLQPGGSSADEVVSDAPAATCVNHSQQVATSQNDESNQTPVDQGEQPTSPRSPASLTLAAAAAAADAAPIASNGGDGSGTEPHTRPESAQRIADPRSPSPVTTDPSLASVEARASASSGAEVSVEVGAAASLLEDDLGVSMMIGKSDSPADGDETAEEPEQPSEASAKAEQEDVHTSKEKKLLRSILSMDGPKMFGKKAFGFASPIKNVTRQFNLMENEIKVLDTSGHKYDNVSSDLDDILNS